MFKKKKPPITRNVKPQHTANVFSYYNNRSASDSSDMRRQDLDKPKEKKLSRADYVLSIPTLITALILVGCVAYVTTLSTHPKVQMNTANSSNSSLDSLETYEQGMEEIFASSIQNRSKLIINTDSLADTIQSTFPELGEVSVVLPLAGRRPIVQVSPVSPKIILTTDDDAFVIDANGRITGDAESVPSSVRETLPVIQDQSGVALARGQFGLSKESVSFVHDVAFQLKSASVTPQSMILTTTPNEMHVRLSDSSYYVKFNLRGKSREQAGTLLATIRKLDSENIKPQQYIDVRVPGKVYYK